MAPLCVKSLSLHSFALSQAPILPLPHIVQAYVPKYCTFVYCTVYCTAQMWACFAVAEPKFGAQESIPPPYVAWLAGTSNRVVVPVLGIDSWAP